MLIKRTIVLGMLAFATLAGCTTGMGHFASDMNSATDSTVSGSSAIGPDEAAICAENGGWYDTAAGACDDNEP